MTWDFWNNIAHQKFRAYVTTIQGTQWKLDEELKNEMKNVFITKARVGL